MTRKEETTITRTLIKKNLINDVPQIKTVNTSRADPASTSYSGRSSRPVTRIKHVINYNEKYSKLSLGRVMVTVQND